MKSYEETYDNLRLADIAGDIIRDLACQKNERECRFTKDDKSFDADWYFRRSQEETVDWSEMEPLLDSPNDIMVRFELIRQRYNRVDGTTHSWLECKIVGQSSSNTTIEKTAPPAATWANLVRGKTTKAKLQQQQEGTENTVKVEGYASSTMSSVGTHTHHSTTTKEYKPSQTVEGYASSTISSVGTHTQSEQPKAPPAATEDTAKVESYASSITSSVGTHTHHPTSKYLQSTGPAD